MISDQESQLRSNMYLQRMVRHWNKMPTEVVESLSLEEFKKGVDVVLEDMV